MRVALNGYFWSQSRTGSGQYLRHLWEALQALPDEAPADRSDPLDLFMLLPPGGGGEDTVPPGRRASVVRARPDIVSAHSPNVGKLLWEQWAVAQQAQTKGADLLHSPYLTAPLLFPPFAREKGRYSGKANSRSQYRQVVTAHDMIPWVLPGYNESRFFKLYLALAAAGVKRVAAIMADSEASRRDVIRVLRVPPGRVFTVYLGAEPPPRYSAEELETVRRRFGLPRCYAFYLGGFDRRKNVLLLLRAWHNVYKALEIPGDEKPVLAIGGVVPGSGGVFPDVAGEAAALGLSGPDAPLRFLGRISEADKPLLMAAAHVFLYPSSYEGFGLDPLEAMSLGCPVVSSSGGSLSEVVGTGGLLVAPNDVGAFSGAIIRAWQDDDLRVKLAHLGRAQAARFTWERTARQTLQVYRHTLQRGKAR